MESGTTKEGEGLTGERRIRIAHAVQSFLNGDDIRPGEDAAPQEDLDAVGYAFDEMAADDRSFCEKVTFAELIFVRGMTMTAACGRCYISYATAKRWKAQILDQVDRWLR